MQYGRSPGPMNTIALLKREEEEATLGTPLARGKLTHYRWPYPVGTRGKSRRN
jgi:hypothetical protein